MQTTNMDNQLPKKFKMTDKLRKPFKKRHSVVYHQGTNRVNKYLAQAIDARSVDREKSTHVNVITLCFKDKYKERQYHEEKDRGFGMALACAMAVLILLGALQIAILPRTLILVILFLVAFVWISVLLILVLGARLQFTCLEDTSCGTTSGSDEKTVIDDHRLCPFPHYIIMSCILSFFPLVIFLRLPMMLKAALLIPMAAVFLIVIEFTHNRLFQCTYEFGVPLNITGPVIIVHFVLAVLIHGRQVEWTARLDFLWNSQAYEEKADMHELQSSNRRILFNLLPSHVATHFLDNQFRNNMDLYHQSYTKVGVCFASIPNFMEFYMELDGNNQGVECLRLLNEIIADFDELLDHQKYKAIDKIKTVGSCYMAAIGLMPEFRIPETDNAFAAECMACLVDLVFEMRDRLSEINENSYNNFMLRVGLNIGPVVAGVIGARKPQYDIWGDTVNLASRMDSTGLPNHTQCTEDVYQLLKDYPYDFQCRGRVKVKGKGEMTTYFLIDRKNQRMPNNYEFIGSANNGSNRAVVGGVVNPFSQLTNDKNNSKNNSNSKTKKSVVNDGSHSHNSRNIFANSPSLQPLIRNAMRSATGAKRSDTNRSDTNPSYNPPKPIITDMERPKMNRSPLNTISSIAEEPSAPELTPNHNNKGDAWETLKELSSSVPPPPPESDHFVCNQDIQRPLTIVSPTGVQETNLDDITPPLPPRDHSNKRQIILFAIKTFNGRLLLYRRLEYKKPIWMT
ncbi:unnamed protein product [Oppiella nova]|uniref:adenylate cyclase n=1 Tax=Oppiella nova TaxID=334625 RepID=A0A7R9QJ29_9ACAR|nr:unnamed protein product [Oppiella nova]CAG2166355.1 unnamed protein product [Oppiella nova]